ncbi:hypothetical protein BB560_002628 [Smittium megazygosporum]|uniref:Uncharacterized protein n=4 Tax=Smittium megazygosporum TaxID=133381 RepID=A0A2T9ZE97_9FUNG|nr:hypothetical protein BB560_002628 [Smittium megazygosporum]
MSLFSSNTEAQKRTFSFGSTQRPFGDISFGATTTPASVGTSLFGKVSTAQNPSTGSLNQLNPTFGSSTLNTQSTPFGTNTTTGSGLNTTFGTTSLNTGNQTSNQPSGFQFGLNTSNTALGSSTVNPNLNNPLSSFGNAFSKNQTQPSGGLNKPFGSTFGTNIQPSSGGLFGTGNQSTAFSTNLTSAQPTSGLFGSNTGLTSNTTLGSGFGNFGAQGTTSNTTSNVPNTLFGMSSDNAFSKLLSERAPNIQIQYSTKYSDLPDQAKLIFKEIETFKKNQIDIGVNLGRTGIKAQVELINKQIYEFEQSLASIKLGIENNKKAIKNESNKINKYLRVADSLISVISQAIDDVSWENSGLTPLQMTQKQNLFGDQGRWVSPLSEIESSAELASIKSRKEFLKISKPAKTVEAQRRIQLTLMNSSATEDFFWDWLSGVEEKFSEIQQILDSLVKYVMPMLEQQSSEENQNTHGANYSKTISEIVRNQTNILLGLGYKFQKLEEKIESLKQRKLFS